MAVIPDNVWEVQAAGIAGILATSSFKLRASFKLNLQQGGVVPRESRPAQNRAKAERSWPITQSGFAIFGLCVLLSAKVSLINP